MVPDSVLVPHTLAGIRNVITGVGFGYANGCFIQ